MQSLNIDYVSIACNKATDVLNVHSKRGGYEMSQVVVRSITSFFTQKTTTLFHRDLNTLQALVKVKMLLLYTHTTGASSPDIYLPTVQVVDGKFTAHALLDTVSTNIFVSEKLMAKLDRDISHTHYKMNTLSGSTDDSAKMTPNIDIASLDGTQHVSLENVMVWPNIPARYPAHEVAVLLCGLCAKQCWLKRDCCYIVPFREHRAPVYTCNHKISHLYAR